MEQITPTSDLAKFEEQAFRAFIPKTEIRLYQMKTPFEVKREDGEDSTYGKPGDYLVVTDISRFAASEDFVNANYEVDRRSEDQKMKDFIEDPNTRKLATGLAVQIAEQVNGNWFTLELLMKKTGLVREEARAKLATLELLDLAVKEYRGPENALELKYKIILLPAQKASVLRRDLVRIDEHRAKLVAEIDRLDPSEAMTAVAADI